MFVREARKEINGYITISPGSRTVWGFKISTNMSLKIEELGMLKMLEHLYEMLHNGKRIKYDDIREKNGIEFKYWTKLLNNGIVERSGQAKKPLYKWVGIKPNIYMAKRIMADDLYFGDGTFDSQDEGDESLKINYWIRYNEKLAEFHFGSQKNKLDTDGSMLLHKSLEPEKCVTFFNQCLEKYPIFNVFTPNRENLYHPSFNEIRDLFYEFLYPCEHSHLELTKAKSLSVDEKKINIEFSVFWDLYDKKEDRDKCEKKWRSLTNKEREEIMQKLPPYIQATPDKKYRKNPITYLNNKSWNNEIVAYIKDPIQQPKSQEKTIQQYADTELWDELKRRGYSGTITKSLA